MLSAAYVRKSASDEQAVTGACLKKREKKKKKRKPLPLLFPVLLGSISMRKGHLECGT
jgi:hypothetical protein